MKKEIKFSLVFRDMWQSAGKYVPRVDQVVKVAPAIIEMGCFARVETNGGGFEQVNLLFGENPNKAVREWTKPFHEAGIQTHMLDRALNGLRMSPVPADVRKLFYKVKKAQGTDITRTFCGLNDTRNTVSYTHLTLPTNKRQGYGRYRTSGFFGQDCGQYQGGASRYSYPVS